MVIKVEHPYCSESWLFWILPLLLLINTPITYLFVNNLPVSSLAAGQTTSWIPDCQLGIPSAVNQPTYLSDRRVEFKIASLASWYTKCCQPTYLPVWLAIFISPQKVLLAPSSGKTCSVTRVHSRFGEMFCCSWSAGPRIWNNLHVPASLP